MAQVIGGDGIGPIVLAALVGAPAYLNGYAAVPLLEGLLSQGMNPGAAMAFVIAGGVSCIPAAVAVWALVKTPIRARFDQRWRPKRRIDPLAVQPFDNVQAACISGRPLGGSRR